MNLSLNINTDISNTPTLNLSSSNDNKVNLNNQRETTVELNSDSSATVVTSENTNANLDFGVMPNLDDKLEASDIKSGTNINVITNNDGSITINASSYDDTALLKDIKELYSTKLNKLAAGTGISISPANVISATTSAYNYRGNVNTYDELPTKPSVGETYCVIADNTSYTWNGTSWNNVGSSFNEATELSSGLMSAEDKTKLDNITASSPIININEYCGDGTYSIDTAITALLDKYNSDGVNINTKGLIITYRTSDTTWEAKQYTSTSDDIAGSDFSTVSNWTGFGSGGSGGSTDSITYYMKLLNNLSSLSLAVSADDFCYLDFTYLSKYKYSTDTEYTNTDERGLILVSIKNSKYSVYTVVSLFYVNSNVDFTLDISSFLSSGTNYVMLKATGETSGQITPALVYTVLSISLALTSPNFSWWTPFTDDITVPFYVSGNISKTLIVNIKGDNYSLSYEQSLGTTTYTDTAYNMKLSHPSTEGVYHISAYLLNSDATIKTKTISWNIIYVLSDSLSKFMCVNAISTDVKNWSENTLFKYSIYDAGLASSNVIFSINKDGTTIYTSNEGNVATATENSFGYSMELDISKTSFEIVVEAADSNSSDLTDELTFTVSNTSGYSAIEGAIFYLNSRLRTNSQSNKTSIINAVDSSIYNATWTGLSWTNDGWTTDDDDHRLLRVMAEELVNIPYLPFGTECARIGKTIEIDYKIYNVTDYSKPVITIATDSNDTFTGLKIYPDSVYPCSSSLKNKDIQSIPTDNDVRIRMTLVIMPDVYGNSGFNLCCIYINGKRNRVFSYASNDYWALSGNIIIGSNYADIDIYGIRIYNSGLDSSAVKLNYINWLATTDLKATEVNNNDILDILGTSIDFDKVKSKMNVFTFDKEFPNLANPSSVTGTLTMTFASTGNTTTITKVKCSGQGTSSKKYWEWNEKFALGSTSVVTYSDGTTETGIVKMFSDIPKCSTLTAKKNWASSMQDHKEGSVNSFNALAKKIGLTNEAIDLDSTVRHSVYQEPFVGFSKSTAEDGTVVYTCMGEFTFGPDKGDKYCFGYDTTTFPGLISIEGSDNSPLPALFRVPWNTSRITYSTTDSTWVYNNANCFDFDGGLASNISKWIPAYNLVYSCSNRILPFDGTLEELNAAVSTYKSTGFDYWIAKDKDENQYNLYYYEAGDGAFIGADIGNGTINLKTLLVDKGYSWTENTTTVTLTTEVLNSATDNDTKNLVFIKARIAKFRAEIGKYFDVSNAIFHSNWVEFSAGTDNRAKNTYPYTFGTDTSLWKWRQDDTDTIFPITNQGQLRKGYYVEVHDVYDNNTNVWNGETSVFWNLLELAFPNEISLGMSSMLKAMESLGGLSSGTHLEKIYAWYSKYYLDVKEAFCTALVNADQKRYDLAKLKTIAGIYTNDTDPLTQSLGDLFSCETSWMKKRIEYIMSKYSYGEFSADGTDSINVRAAGNLISYEITPAINMYPTIINGTSVIKGSRTPAGEVCTIPVELSGTGDQQNIIQGANYLMSIGDWHDKYVTGNLIIKGKMLRELILGNDTASSIVIAITGLTLGNCVSLQNLKLTNISTLTGVLDLSACTHLRSLYAGGTSLSQIKLATGCGLSYIKYPSTNQYLVLLNFPILTEDNVDVSDCLTSIVDYYINDCPNISSLPLLVKIINAQPDSGHSLKHIRATNFEETFSDTSILDTLAKITDGTYYGLSSTGLADETNYPKPVLDGIINVGGNCYLDTVDTLKDYFGSTLTLNITGSYYIRFEDSTVQNICSSKWGDGSGLTKIQAAAVTDLGSFSASSTFTSFDELKYFNNVTSIGGWAFGNIKTLKSIDLSNIVTLGVQCFQNCTSLETVNLSSKFTTVTNWYGCFINCTSLKNVGDISGLTQIYGSLFQSCNVLPSVNISNKCTKIGENAFYECFALTSIGDVSKVTIIDQRGFYHCTSLTDLSFPECTSIGQEAFRRGSLTSISFGKLTTVVGGAQFGQCANLTQITGLNNIITINDEFCVECPNLESIDLGQSCTSIGDSTFRNCTKLTSVGDTSNVVTINNNAFASCSSLISLNLTNKCKKIGSVAFNSCTSLISIGDTSGVTSLSNSIFERCSSLLSIDLSSMTTIPDYCFNQASSLTSIITTLLLTSIGQQSFYGCTNLSTLPNLTNVTSIGSNAFAGCTSLIGNLILPEGLITMGNGSFQWCKFDTITIPSTVTIVGENTFEQRDVIARWAKCLATTPPTGAGQWLFTNGATYPIYVPDASLATYKVTSGWSNFSSRLKALSSFATDFPNG